VKTGVNSYLTELASVYEASESITVVPLPVNLKFGNWKKLSSSAAMRLLSVALTMGLMSITGEALALQKIGSNNSQVANSQRCLRKLGYFNGPVTGKFANLTKNAVINFQQAKRLPAVGFIGPSTQRALQRACQGRNPSRNVARSSNLTTQEVRELQQRLKQLGYFKRNPTGKTGPITREAIAKFQQDRRLPVNGVANREILAAVRRASTVTARFPTQQPTINYLSLGERGENVRLVQERLVQLGFSNINPDGYFSDETRQSVIAFQQYSRLNPTGNVDGETWQALGLNSSSVNNSVEPSRYVLPPSSDYVVPVANGNTLAADNPYRVIVPISNNDTLSKVQQYIPNAVTEKSNLGDYVNAGAFNDRKQAENLTKMLRSYGLDARVKFN
jgi:peptidoglycan hydrolase-like protein with peptidoglycan-binding domain